MRGANRLVTRITISIGGIVTSVTTWKWQKISSEGQRWELASARMSIGFQARKRALDGHRRAVAIDDNEVCQKPLFASIGVSSDFFELRIKIGMCGDGKICQWKRKPVTGGLQECFF